MEELDDPFLLFLLHAFLGGEAQENHVRVKQTIPYILEEIVNEKNILPNKVFTEKYDAVPYPYSVTKRRAFSQFGLEMEELALFALRIVYGQKFETAQLSGPTLSVFSEGGGRCYPPSIKPSSFLQSVSPQDIVKYQDDINAAYSGVVTYFKNHYPHSQVEKVVAGSEICCGDLAGHPDFVIHLPNKEVVIFDVKVFARMVGGCSNREIKAQISLYVALYRENGYVCNKIGIIMPWKRDPIVKMYDVTKWDSAPLLKIALASVEKVKGEMDCRMRWSGLLERYNVGSHTSLDIALGFAAGKPAKEPFQFFLYGNNPSSKSEAEGRRKMALLNPNFGECKAFVHAPYNLNFASEAPYVVHAAKEYMKDCAKYGIRGVVFHCGHHEDPRVGVEIMERNIRKVLSVVSIHTPFILETPCGNKNELLSTPEEFGEFICRFPELKLGACVDTAHTFVSGFYPLDYIERLSQGAKDRICLLHFNGCRKKHACHSDGHAHVTRPQNIPDEQLIGVLDIAEKWGICSVTE